MQIEADAELSLFVRDQTTGRLVFNSKAIEALGLSPAELAQRGYQLNGQVTSPGIVPQDETWYDALNASDPNPAPREKFEVSFAPKVGPACRSSP
jgi:hypothetical protein